MRLFTMLLILSIIGFETKAQTDEILSVAGIVLNAVTNEPIPYANIGILNTEIGTLSNEDGSVSGGIPKKYSDQYLIFSSIGYEKSSISIGRINL